MTEIDLPWGDMKVCFDCYEPDILWKNSDDIEFPKGWELTETTISGAAGFVAIFRVEVFPSIEDGRIVQNLITKHDGTPKRKRAKATEQATNL